MIKKILAILLTVALTLAGMYLAFIANVEEHEPYNEGGLSVLAAISFALAALCAGYGNSITWKGKKKSSHGRR